MLHCPAYRETYAQFLKIDFPRIPYPSSPASFADIAAKGGELRALHLMQPEAIGPTPFSLKGEGDMVVDKPHFESAESGVGRVFINATQYFDAVPQLAWDFSLAAISPPKNGSKTAKPAS